MLATILYEILQVAHLTLKQLENYTSTRLVSFVR